MGLFDKKYCDICGSKIGLLGNRKLENGNLCKECAGKLSPFFSERKHSTVEEIQQQLTYRENNRAALSDFRATRSIGVDTKVLLDENRRQFVVTSASNLLEENPDIIPLQDVIACNLDIQHSREELKYQDKEGKSVSYQPPRYEYSYTFYIEINVNHPYFSQIRFRLNPRAIEITSEPPRRMALTGAGRFLNGVTDDIHPEYNVEYRQYQQMADEILEALTPTVNRAETSGQDGTAQNTDAASMVGSEGGSWNCAACGAVTKGNFCEYCGSKRPD